MAAGESDRGGDGGHNTACGDAEARGTGQLAQVVGGRRPGGSGGEETGQWAGSRWGGPRVGHAWSLSLILKVLRSQWNILSGEVLALHNSDWGSNPIAPQMGFEPSQNSGLNAAQILYVSAQKGFSERQSDR